MSYELKKPITEKQKNDFIVEYNHNKGLIIANGSDTYNVEELTFKADFIFALEANEIMSEVEVEIDIPDEMEEEQEEQTYHKETVMVYKPIINPDYEQEQAEKRQAKFENTFFNIPSFGWFRKIPKGYSSAVESLNTAFNIVAVLGNLPADTLIFYVAPDFTDPEQCTEEWLIAHQTKNPQMTAQEFGVFYAEFITAWNNQEHIREVE